MLRTAGVLIWLGFALAPFDATAFGQVDIAGDWADRIHEERVSRLDGPNIADYAGIPLSDALRLNSETWHPSLLSVKEHQSNAYGSVLCFYAPFGKRISKVIDERSQRVQAYTVTFGVPLPSRTIWMDGRPHPPDYAAHTWAGFSTGRWDGSMLTVRTTHLKAGYIARNGVRHTDRATMIEHFIRHGAYLTIIVIVEDPGYLEEPFVQSWNFALNPDQQFPPAADTTTFDEIAGYSKGYVPHYLPGQNPYLREFSELSGIPFEATRGGKETMYPEYSVKLRGVRTKRLPASSP